MDLHVYDLAALLAAELSAALEHTRAGQADFVVVHPGDMVPQYGCALAAVRLVTILPVAPKPRCAPEWQITYEMSVDRCYPSTENNAMPPVAWLDSAVRDQLEDAGAMRKAALCAWPNDQGRLYGTWTPRGPAGGIYGGAMQVTATGVCLTRGCEDGPWGDGIDARIPPFEGDPRHPG